MTTRRHFEIVAFPDAGVKLGESDLATYVRDWDISHLRFRDDPAPMIFVCRPLSNATYLDHVYQELREGHKLRKAFCASVVRVRNARLQDGRTCPQWEPGIMAELDASDLANRVDLVSADELELFPLWQVASVGAAAVSRAELPLPCDHGLPLPRIVWQALASARDLLAALEPKPSAESSGTDGGPPAQVQTAPDAPSGGPGDATATM